MRRRGCQGHGHVDCRDQGRLWTCRKCLRKFCWNDGAADQFPYFCDECWNKTVDAPPSLKKQLMEEARLLNKEMGYDYEITVRTGAFATATGKATLALDVDDNEGILNLYNSDGIRLGWIQMEELNAIARDWLNFRNTSKDKYLRAWLRKIRRGSSKRIT